MSEWRDISTAPKDGTAIWLLVDGHQYIGYCRPADWLNKKESWFLKATFLRRENNPDEIYGCYAFDTAPTHWMPLPEPPENSDVDT